jgi:hypothetical protein
MKKTDFLIPLGLFAVFCSVLSIWWLRDHTIAGENAIMENIQVGFLLLALFFVLKRFLRERTWNPVLMFFFLTFLTVLLREVDLRPFQLPRFIILLSSKGRDLALSFGWVVFLYFFIRSYNASVKEFKTAAGKASGRYFLFGCLFYLIASTFDEGLFGITKEKTQFLEELMENIGTLSFAFASLYYSKEYNPGYGAREGS